MGVGSIAKQLASKKWGRAGNELAGMKEGMTFSSE